MLAALRWDMTIQFRNGFYYVGGFMVVFWLVVLSFIPITGPFSPALLAPFFVTVNMLMTTFYFVAGLVLLEKGEGSLVGMVISPLRDSEYLAARTLSLTLLAAAETTFILLVVLKGADNALLLLAGTLLMGALYSLIGFASVARYESVNGYLLPSALVVVFLMLPLLGLLGIWPAAWWLHPLQPAIILVTAAYEPLSSGVLLWALAAGSAWLAAAAWLAQRAFKRSIRGATLG